MKGADAALDGEYRVVALHPRAYGASQRVPFGQYRTARRRRGRPPARPGSGRGPARPGDDTYAIAQSERIREGLDVQAISDLGRLVDECPEGVTLCLNDDDSRTQVYGRRFPEEDPIEVLLDAVYGAGAEGVICIVGVVRDVSSGEDRDGGPNCHALLDTVLCRCYSRYEKVG